MDNTDTFSINLNIDFIGNIKLTIPRDEEVEKIYREAGKTVNENIRHFHEEHRLPPDHIIAMAAINIAYQALTTGVKADMTPLLEELNALNTELEKHLETPEEHEL